MGGLTVDETDVDVARDGAGRDGICLLRARARVRKDLVAPCRRPRPTRALRDARSLRSLDRAGDPVQSTAAGSSECLASVRKRSATAQSMHTESLHSEHFWMVPQRCL